MGNMKRILYLICLLCLENCATLEYEAYVRALSQGKNAPIYKTKISFYLDKNDKTKLHVKLNPKLDEILIEIPDNIGTEKDIIFDKKNNTRHDIPFDRKQFDSRIFNSSIKVDSGLFNDLIHVFCGGNDANNCSDFIRSIKSIRSLESTDDLFRLVYNEDKILVCEGHSIMDQSDCVEKSSRLNLNSSSADYEKEFFVHLKDFEPDFFMPRARTEKIPVTIWHPNYIADDYHYMISYPRYPAGKRIREIVLYAHNDSYSRFKLLYVFLPFTVLIDIITSPIQIIILSNYRYRI